METLITITKVLGLVTLCVIFVLILLSIFTAPYRQRKADKEIEKISGELTEELIKALKEDDKKQPKKRGRKPKKVEEKEDK